MEDLLKNKEELPKTGFIYNPHLLKSELLEKLFVVRQKQFELLLNSILQEKNDSIPQHYLIIGQRGMGKTTLLKRIEIELRKDKYQQIFIPLLYREEQYNVKDLGDFWLNTLDALADSLQHEKYPKERLNSIDKTIQEISNKTSEIIAEEAYKFLLKICRELNRRPVLLIDNIGIVFSRLDSNLNNKKDQWALRKLLSENGAPIFVSAGVTVMPDVVDYNMPFYDFFQIHYLRKLDDHEFTTLLINYAIASNCDEAVISSIKEKTSRQKSLLALTGGSPRLTVILFEHIVKGFSDNINDDLEKLVDAITPLYKSRFEELSSQQQIILDAIALKWDAISLKELSSNTRLQNNQLSPQLKRLIDDGWIETTPAYKAQGNAYFISERFFNIYYIIRNSSRRHKEKIYCLSKFLEYFYGKDDLEEISNILLKQDINSKEQMRLIMAFRDIKILEEKTRDQLQNSIKKAFNYKELREEFDYPESEFLLSKGRELLDIKQFNEAIIYLDEIIKIDPDNENGWALKTICLLELKRYDEAIIYSDNSIACLEKKLKFYNENIERYKNNNTQEILNVYIEMKNVTLQAKEVINKTKALTLRLLNRNEEALECLNKTIELNPEDQMAWKYKTIILIELKKYREAIFILEIFKSDNPNEKIIKYYLLFLYRDKLNEMDKALELFNSIAAEDINNDENKQNINCFYLNKSLFELYKRNEGLAKENLLQAFEIFEKEDELLSAVNGFWSMQFASVVIELGYGSWLLAVLEEKGYNIVLSPYYSGIKALEIERQDEKNGKNNAEIYLKNIAAEISVAAREIIIKIRKFMS